MSDCIFCKIINKEIPSEIVYEDDKILAFKDIDPQAPVHILIIPKVHINSLDELDENQSDLIGYLIYNVKKIVQELGLENGYRLVNNCGVDGYQTVNHIHFHLIGGRKMQWPPG